MPKRKPLIAGIFVVLLTSFALYFYRLNDQVAEVQVEPIAQLAEERTPALQDKPGDLVPATVSLGVKEPEPEATEETPSTAEKKPKNRKLKPLKERNYRVDEAQIQSTLESLEAEYRLTDDPETAFKLARIYARCKRIPMEWDAFQAWHQKNYERYAPSSNFDAVDAMQSADAQAYEQCSAFLASHPEIDFSEKYLEYLEKSAYADGFPEALAELARAGEFAQKLTVMPDEQSTEIKTELGERLLEARASCSKAVMGELAFRRGEGENWIMPVDVPKGQHIYAMLWTYGAIEKFIEKAGKLHMGMHSSRLKRIARDYELTDEQVEQSVKNGKRYFRAFCTEKL
ncbi:hypothetical protein SAMN02745866_01979 [Alteromonadaceae bacterium Bs31]|nr:hypothetical protein SAMN02745866_01979 [Alteromonadaceae bacterium Bs31]